MGSNLFEREAPEYVGRLRDEVAERTVRHPLVQAVAQGNTEAIRAFYDGLWGFVKPFPRLVYESCLKHFFRMVYSVGLSNIIRTIKIVRQMELEEKTHSVLWRKAATAVAMTEKDLGRHQISSVGQLCRLLSEAEPFELFLRLWATEIIAMSSSSLFLGSAPFRKQVGPRGIDWFLVHANHHDDGWSHEKIDICYALTTYSGKGSELEPRSNQVVRHFADAFWIAAEDALKVTREGCFFYPAKAALATTPS